MRRWVPQPVLTGILAATWVLLSNDVGGATLAVGMGLGLIIPHVTLAFWPGVGVRKPLKILQYVMRLVWDVVAANFQVAVLVLGPQKRMKPAFITFPWQLTNEFAVIVLACTISLTPGTVTVDVDSTRRCLLIHCLNAPDPSALVRRLRQRYEDPLKEIFP